MVNPAILTWNTPALATTEPIPVPLDGLDLWLDASTLSSMSPGAPISVWEDQSDAGNDATQTVPASKPTFDIVDGFPAAKFEQQYLVSDASASSQQQSVFMVVKRADGAGVSTFIGPSSAAGGYALDSALPGDYLRTRIWGSASMYIVVNFTTSVNALFVAGGGINADVGDAFLHRNTYTKQTRTAPYALVSGLLTHLGAKSTSSEMLNGHILEVIHYSRFIAPGERAGIQSYLAAKYEI